MVIARKGYLFVSILFEVTFTHETDVRGQTYQKVEINFLLVVSFELPRRVPRKDRGLTLLHPFQAHPQAGCPAL